MSAPENDLEKLAKQFALEMNAGIRGDSLVAFALDYLERATEGLKKELEQANAEALKEGAEFNSELLQECSELRAELAEAKEKLKELREILTRKRTEDTCQCDRCLQAIREHGPLVCKTCGFRGEPVSIGCQCYDHFCSGGTSAGSGCPHGAITCPVCDDGNGDFEPFAVMRELNAALSANETKEVV